LITIIHNTSFEYNHTKVIVLVQNQAISRVFTPWLVLLEACLWTAPWWYSWRVGTYMHSNA